MTDFTIAVHVRAGDERAADVAEIVRGLSSHPPTLSPKFLYHEAGSGLFDEITQLDEYYPTRVERGLLDAHGADLVRAVRPAEIVELGPGNSAKSGTIVGPALAQGTLRRYVPFDISESAVREGGRALADAYPDLPEVAAVVGDFFRHLPAIPPAQGPRLVAFLGSTIGNLHPGERAKFLADVRALLPPEGGALLIGADLVKDVSVIEAAYNDAKGVTAQFNLNALNAVNDLLGVGVDTALFRHLAFFNREESRIEMHLEAVADAVIPLPGGAEARFRPGDTIWTESSYKFTRDGFARTLADAGFRDVVWRTAPGDLFALALALP